MAGNPATKARRAGNLVYTSGQVGRREDGTIAEGIVEQTKYTLLNLEAALASEGMDRSHVVRCTVYMSDLSQRPEMNVPYSEFFGDNIPARAAVGVDLGGTILVEIDAVAYKE